MRLLRTVALFTSLLVAGSMLLPTAVNAAAPTLRVLAASSHVDASRSGGRYVYLDPGVYLAAFNAPFEIRVARASYTDPIEAWQELSPGTTPIPTDLLDHWYGLRKFAQIWIYRDGTPIRSVAVNWCPGWSYFQRVDDSGPASQSYPQLCDANPFTLGAVWGIDEGWAAPLSQGVGVKLAEGDYDVVVRIREQYRNLFGIAPADAEASVSLTVSGRGGGCVKCPAADATAGSTAGRVRAAAVPIDTTPDPGTVPDLIPLPAYGIRVEHTRKGHDVLSFGADVWNRGPAPLWIEGFRQAGEDTMNAYQYFTDAGAVVARAPVGDFEFDTRQGHDHWHFEQFARYRLLGADEQAIVRSRKQSFCLAPTDPIDMLAPNADWQPDWLGFSQCGGSSALWIRETLPVGWGDTYYQSVGGQGFDITDLPNGTYYIEVTANPTGLLYEADTANDTMLRKVILRGVPGDRRVFVPAWNGIDTEGNH